MPWLRITFLVFVLAVSSGYRFRCYWLCTDQTSTQNDYIEQRDRCREYAQLKLDMAIKNSAMPDDDQHQKSQLVSLFSECMAKNGWDVPAGKGGDKEKAPAAAAAPAAVPAAPATAATAAAPTAGIAPLVPVEVSPAAALTQKAQDHAFLARKSECDFARQSAENSTIAANRAKACDLECAQRMQAAPETPRPAACPTQPAESMGQDTERTD